MSTMHRVALMSLGVAVAPGCYLSHTPEDPPLAEPSPCADEPPVGASARPSDGPAADDWGEPPTIEGPCCHVVGRNLDEPAASGGGVGIATVAGETFVAWNGEEHLTARLARFGSGAIDAPAPSHDIAVATAPTDLAPGCGRLALAGSEFIVRDRRTSEPPLLAQLGLDGSVFATTELPSARQGGAVTRHAALHRWAVLTYSEIDDDRLREGETLLRLFDDALVPIHTVDLGATRYAGVASIGVLSLGSRLVVVRSTSDGVLATTFLGRVLDRGPEDLRALVTGGHSASKLAAVRFRDEVLVFAYAGGPIRVARFDPFGRGFVGEPTEVLWSGLDQKVGAAADELGGTIGLCYATRTRGSRALWLALVGADGAVIGMPVQVDFGPDGGGLDPATVDGRCRVASPARDAYVVSWISTNATGIARAHAVSLRVRRDAAAGDPPR